MLDPAAETLGKIIADPESASRGAPCRPRPIVQDDAIHQRADSCQLDLDFSGPRVEARMLRGIGYELVDDQSEPPSIAPIGAEEIRLRVPAGYSFDPATNGAWRSPSADVCRGVDQRLALGHCERLLHIGITMQQFDHVA